MIDDTISWSNCFEATLPVLRGQGACIERVGNGQFEAGFGLEAHTPIPAVKSKGTEKLTSFGMKLWKNPVWINSLKDWWSLVFWLRLKKEEFSDEFFWSSGLEKYFLRKIFSWLEKQRFRKSGMQMQDYQNPGLQRKLSFGISSEKQFFREQQFGKKIWQQTIKPEWFRADRS